MFKIKFISDLQYIYIFDIKISKSINVINCKSYNWQYSRFYETKFVGQTHVHKLYTLVASLMNTVNGLHN